MRPLAAFQRELKELLFFRGQEPTTSPSWPDAIPTRLDVYRNNVRMNWTDTLDCDFPLTRKQFSDGAWRALQAHYFEKYPPQHWELNSSMTPFASFLSRQKIKAYVKELADWEWQDLRTFVDRAEVKRGMGVANPTAVVRVYQHQIFDWVNAGASSERPPAQKPEVLVFYRDPKNTCHIREADPLMLLVLEHFKTPNASAHDLEPARQKLLPGNDVPLQNVVDALAKDGLLLL